MSEATLWKNLRKKMLPRYWKEATRHEDKYARGIADVSFVQTCEWKTYYPMRVSLHGWVELKYKAQAPIRPSTICKIDHYTDEQRNWLKAKGKAGGMTFLMLQLGQVYFLFDHIKAQDVGLVVTEELYDLACWHSCGNLDGVSLWEAINDNG